jgi:hypothetical protein
MAFWYGTKGTGLGLSGMPPTLLAIADEVIEQGYLRSRQSGRLSSRELLSARVEPAVGGRAEHVRSARTCRRDVKRDANDPRRPFMLRRPIWVMVNSCTAGSSNNLAVQGQDELKRGPGTLIA